MTIALTRGSRRIIGEIGSHRPMVVSLDVDGTLAPLARTPDAAAVPESTLSVLHRLDSHKRVTLVLVSGRSVREVRAMTGEAASWIIGNHGNERAEREGVPELKLPSRAVRELDRAYRRLSEAVNGIPGVLLEHKGATLGVHYRTVRTDLRNTVQRRVRKTVGDLDLAVRTGKMMLDLRPHAAADKGKAVSELLVELCGRKWEDTAWVFYAGDDTTDEDVFSVLAEKGVTVKVGNGPTRARYRTRSPKTLARWLDRLERGLD